MPGRGRGAGSHPPLPGAAVRAGPDGGLRGPVCWHTGRVLCGDFLGNWGLLCPGAKSSPAHKTLGSPDTGCHAGEPRNVLR